MQQHDLNGAMLLPGFIDVQVNGGGGVLFNEAPTVEAIRAIGVAHRRFGTTGFLPTLISDDVQVMQAALAAVEQALAEGVPGLLGIHLEGPYLAPARKGVHDPKFFHVPDEADLARLTAPRRGVRLITLAPDQVSPQHIAELTCGRAHRLRRPHRGGLRHHPRGVDRRHTRLHPSVQRHDAVRQPRTRRGRCRAG